MRSFHFLSRAIELCVDDRFVRNVNLPTREVLGKLLEIKIKRCLIAVVIKRRVAPLVLIIIVIMPFSLRLIKGYEETRFDL